MNFPNVIGLKGKIGAGKSTAAEYFIERGYKLIKVADPLKNMLRALGLSEEQIEGERKGEPSILLSGATPRHAMQTLGTEWGRGIHPDFWVNLWRHEAIKHPLVVVDDCRFKNEALAIHDLCGVVIEIRRPAPPGAADAHISEVQDWRADMCVLNEGFNKEILFARLEGVIAIWDESNTCHWKRDAARFA